MANAVVDVIAPREIILPTDINLSGAYLAGKIFMSGAKLHIDTGSSIEIVTSA